MVEAGANATYRVIHRSRQSNPPDAAIDPQVGGYPIGTAAARSDE